MMPEPKRTKQTTKYCPACSVFCLLFVGLRSTDEDRREIACAEFRVATRKYLRRLCIDRNQFSNHRHIPARGHHKQLVCVTSTLARRGADMAAAAASIALHCILLLLLYNCRNGHAGALALLVCVCQSRTIGEKLN